MPTSISHRTTLQFAAILSMAFVASPTAAQQATPAITTPASGLRRIEGKDPGSGIAYVRILLTAASDAASADAGSPPASDDFQRPTLTVQCTLQPSGKYRFELFVNFGGVTDLHFYPPWKRERDQLFPPRTEKVPVTMEFLGYIKVKPVKRQFEAVLQVPGQLRYNPPGTASSNMEEVSFYFKYLRALPTLHITSPTESATFATTPLLTQIHSEPLCTASGL